MANARIYSYGATAPITNVDLVRAQLRLVHTYRNRLVELELERRRMTDEALRRLCPRLLEVESGITEISSEIEGIEAEIKQLRVKAKGRPKAPKEISGRKKMLESSRKALWKERKELRKALFTSKEWKVFQVEINTWEKVEQKMVRKESSLYWGSYLPVEQAAKAFRKGPPPQFRRWRGDAKIAVQLQGGLSLDELSGGGDTRLRFDQPEGGVWAGKGRICKDGVFRRRKLGNALIYIRVGSDEKKKSIWATVPIIWHRGPPSGSIVKWAYLHRRMRGTKEVWEFQLVLVGEDGVFDRPDRAGTGTVGIDVGWRKYSDRLRVAVWAASDGSEGELSLPAWWINESRRVDRIKSHRSLLLNEAKSSAKERIKELAGIPEWLEEAGKAMHQWKAAARLASLCLRWREAQDPSLLTEKAGEALAELEAWRQRDKHLLEYEANLRAQLQGSRRDLYRRFAAHMSRIYAKAAIEKLDLRIFHKRAPVEDGVTKADDAKTAYARDACLSALVAALKERMREVELLNPKNTTKKCHACGQVDEAWTDHARVDHECLACGLLWDQDVNAARNLLGASGEEVRWIREPLAPIDRMTYGSKQNMSTRRTLAAKEALEMAPATS